MSLQHLFTTLKHTEILDFTYVMTFAKGKGTPALQQSLACALGSLAYDKHEHAVRAALTCLLGGVDKAVRLT
jgi:hypothetical protein